MKIIYRGMKSINESVRQVTWRMQIDINQTKFLIVWYLSFLFYFLLLIYIGIKVSDRPMDSNGFSKYLQKLRFLLL